MPLGQRINLLPKPTQKPKPFEPKYPTILQSIGEMSQMRINVCNKLPTDHPFQPPVITPLSMIPANNPKPSQTTQQTPFRRVSLQQLLKVLKILKNQTPLTYPTVIHPQTCSL